MAETTIFKSESAILKYHSQGIIHHEFLHRMVGQEFKDVLNTGLEQLVTRRATKWLSDDRKNTVLSEEDQRWAETDWFPRAVKAGWKYWAIVNPEKAVGQLQMKGNAKTMEMAGVKVAFFSEPHKAMAWLLSVETLAGAGARQAG